MKTFLPLLLLFALQPAFSGASEMLVNPKFADGFEGWTFHAVAEYRGKVQKPSIVPAGGARRMPELSVNIPHASSWHYVNIKQPIEIVNGSVYTVTFEAKYREAPGDIRIAMWSPQAQKNNGLNSAFTMASYWQRFEAKFRARNVQEAEVPNFIVGFAAEKGNISVRNFSYVETSDETVKGQVKRTIEIAGEADKPQIKTVSVDAQQMVDEFEENINGAKRKYAGRNLVLTAPVTGVDKGARPGSYVLILLDGEIKITAGGRSFAQSDYEKLYTSLRAIRKQVKEDQKEKKAVWDRLDRAAALKREQNFYPTLNCIARIHNYRNRVVEIQQTMDLAVAYPEP